MTLPTIQKTNLRNAFETTLTAQLGPTGLTATVATTAGVTSPAILVIEPDSATQREYVLFDGAFTGTGFVATDIGRRYLTGSAAASGLTHPSGAKVRMVPLAQHVEMLNKRIDQLAVNVKDFGAVGNGVVDDRAAIQTAIDAVEAALLAGWNQAVNPWGLTDASQLLAAGTVYVPPGVFNVGAKLQLKIRRVMLRGAGAYHTAIRAAAAFTPTTDPVLLLTTTGVSGEGGRQMVEGIFFDANNVADHAMVCHRADRARIQDCIFGRANSHGVWRHDTFAAGAGSCHSMEFNYCLFVNNGGFGCADFERSNAKNNTLYLRCFASDNGAGGLLIKGQDTTVIHGNYLSNTDAGIQYGETSDTGITTGGLLVFPWIEGNVGTRQGAAPGVGVGIHCEKAARIFAILGPQAQVSLVDGATAEDKDVALTEFKYGQEGMGFRRGSNETFGQVLLGGSGAPRIKSGNGPPEGVEKGPTGSLYLRLDGGAETSLYVKESGGAASSNGWVAVRTDPTLT